MDRAEVEKFPGNAAEQGVGWERTDRTCKQPGAACVQLVGDRSLGE